MNSKKINVILDDVLLKVDLDNKDLREIEKLTKKFILGFKERLVKKKIKAEVFVGGSFAKKTVINKENLISKKENLYENPDKGAGMHDVDVFIRFDKFYKNEDISKLAFGLLDNFCDFSVIHGSRDYFRIKMNSSFFIELIPVMKVRKPEESKNITDLSYSHVRYINKKIKNKKILGEIKIAKAFCYANNCYGAESYIHGFSGYGIELLVYHYKSFLSFVKAMSKIDKKEIIDIEKFYKNKQVILMDLNSSKLGSPIVLIDPTYKQRNVLAALSNETFNKFKIVCISFLKNPSIDFFEKKSVDFSQIKMKAIKSKLDILFVEAETVKDEGDVAGSKLLKFYKYLELELNFYFEIKDKGFIYQGGKVAKYFFVAKKRKEILRNGPLIKDKKNIKEFKKEHKKCFVKGGKIYSKEKVNFDLNDFFVIWKKKRSKIIREMYIRNLNKIKIKM